MLKYNEYDINVLATLIREDALIRRTFCKRDTLAFAINHKPFIIEPLYTRTTFFDV